MFENGSLNILDARDSDAGHYMCQASNGVGPGLSKVIRITINGKYQPGLLLFPFPFCSSFFLSPPSSGLPFGQSFVRFRFCFSIIALSLGLLSCLLSVGQE